MSHSTVFPVSPELATEFAAEVAKVPPSKSFFQIRIEDETLVLKGSGGFKQDMNEVFGDIKQQSNAGEASYFVVRQAEVGQVAAKWILLMFIPESAKVKDKMLYAATRDTLKRALGAGNFSNEILCNELSDISWEAYQAQQREAAPLNEHEMMARAEKQMEFDSHADSQTKSRLAFPFQQPALDALGQFSAGSIGWLQLRLDVDQEQVVLHKTGGGGLREAAGGLPVEPSPLYTLVRFVHTPPGADAETSKNVFFLFCPDAAKVKEKMLSASVKPSVAQFLESQGIQVAKQFDTDGDPQDVAESTLLGLLYDDPHAEEPAAPSRPAARPSRPGRGGRRMVGSKKPLMDE